MRRVVQLVLVLLVPLLPSSCSSMFFQRTVSRSDVSAAPPKAPGGFTRFATAKGQKVLGFTTTDGHYHKFRGRARLEGDTLVVRIEGWFDGLDAEWPGKASWRVAVADLESVRSEHVPPSFYVVSGILGVAAGVAIVYGVMDAGLLGTP